MYVGRLASVGYNPTNKNTATRIIAHGLHLQRFDCPQTQKMLSSLKEVPCVQRRKTEPRDYKENSETDMMPES